jgi:large subunit ribosomal protein L13
MKTYQPKEKEVQRGWHLMDAKDKVLGRLASEAAIFLMGKHKAVYSNHMDMGDNVVILNSEKIVVTGRKKTQKTYKSHSGYPGGFKERSYEQMMDKHPERILEHAISGMLPDNKLKSGRMKRLTVVTGGKNPHQDKFEVQNPKSETLLRSKRTSEGQSKF